LTPIIGFADMAISSLPSSDPLLEDLEHILTGANRAKELVEQILLFSRQVEKERKPLSIQIIIKEVVKLLRPSIPSTIEIRQRIDTSCEKVLADPSQIHQVIVNLCTNSFQAMENNGGILTIELKQVEVDADTAKARPNLYEKEYVVLSVSDTGIGMENAIIDRIFEPFFTTKAVDKGTGMGLSVVHGIVRSHSGDIHVYSEKGKGSVFHVYLPVVNSQIEIVKKEVDTIQIGQESILVVDDDELIAVMVKKMLEKLGYKIDICKTSIEALKTFRQKPEKYDLLISDLTMPDMTGLDLAKQIQNIRSEFPIIIITGYGDSLAIETRKKYGIKEVVNKPIILRNFASVIRSVIDNNTK